MKKMRAQAGTGEKFVVMEVTPDQAAEWLSSMKGNRRVVEARVKKYAEEMRDGRWELNGESIKIDSKGRLFDGQHRCLAIVESGVPCRSAVFFGQRPESLLTIDTGKARNFADILTMMGEKATCALAAAVRTCYIWDWCHTFLYNPRAPEANPTHAALLQYLKDNPGIREGVAQVLSKTHGRTKLISAGHGGGLYYILARIDSEDVSKFFESVNRGAGLAEDSPIFHLRTRLLDHQTGRLRLMNYEIAALVFKAWNIWRKGGKCAALSVRLGGSAPEAFPIPV